MEGGKGEEGGRAAINITSAPIQWCSLKEGENAIMHIDNIISVIDKMLKKRSHFVQFVDVFVRGVVTSRNACNSGDDAWEQMQHSILWSVFEVRLIANPAFMLCRDRGRNRAIFPFI